MRLVLGVVGFVLFFFYDFNQIKWNNPFVKKFFFIGIALIIVATVSALTFNIVNYMGTVIALIGLAFTVYALFFALDFDATYVDGKFKVYDQGVYALCRHPGFYGLFVLYLGLYITYQTQEFLGMFVIFNVLNFLYICFQDKIVFVKVFSDYAEYKKRVPFLIFNKKSIQECVKLWRKQ